VTRTGVGRLVAPRNMTDEQLIARIRGMTDLAKVDDDREAYRDTRDRWTDCCRALRHTGREWMNASTLLLLDGFQEQMNEIASELKQYEQNIKRIERFIAALDEQAQKLREKIA